MSITSPYTINNKLITLFNSLGVFVEHKVPVTEKNDYREDVITSFESNTIKALPYSQSIQEIFLQSLGDVDVGGQYFALLPDDGSSINIGDYITFAGVDYIVSNREDYTWGEVVMVAVRCSVAETPLPPYSVGDESSS